MAAERPASGSIGLTKCTQRVCWHLYPPMAGTSIRDAGTSIRAAKYVIWGMARCGLNRNNPALGIATLEQKPPLSRNAG
jgi:hypothetical protein